MISAFLIGIVFGLTITLSFGPGFMALFQTSLVRGLGAGFVLASGMLLSDLVLVGISYFGFAGIILGMGNQLLGTIAGIIIIIMGSISLFKKQSVSLSQEKTVAIRKNFTLILLKGFFLNIANPFSLLFWIGIVGFVAKTWGMDSYHVLWFFSGVFITAFSSDLLKCYLSGLMRKVLAGNAIHRINKVMGFVFIAIGMVLIWKVRYGG